LASSEPAQKKKKTFNPDLDQREKSAKFKSFEKKLLGSQVNKASRPQPQVSPNQLFHKPSPKAPPKPGSLHPSQTSSKLRLPNPAKPKPGGPKESQKHAKPSVDLGKLDDLHFKVKTSPPPQPVLKKIRTEPPKVPGNVPKMPGAPVPKPTAPVVNNTKILKIDPKKEPPKKTTTVVSAQPKPKAEVLSFPKELNLLEEIEKKHVVQPKAGPKDGPMVQKEYEAKIFADYEEQKKRKLEYLAQSYHEDVPVQKAKKQKTVSSNVVVGGSSSNSQSDQIRQELEKIEQKKKQLLKKLEQQGGGGTGVKNPATAPKSKGVGGNGSRPQPVASTSTNGRKSLNPKPSTTAAPGLKKIPSASDLIYKKATTSGAGPVKSNGNPPQKGRTPSQRPLPGSQKPIPSQKIQQKRVPMKPRPGMDDWDEYEDDGWIVNDGTDGRAMFSDLIGSLGLSRGATGIEEYRRIVGEAADDDIYDFEDADGEGGVEYLDREEARGYLEATNHEKIERIRNKQGDAAAEAYRKKLKSEAKARRPAAAKPQSTTNKKPRTK